MDSVQESTPRSRLYRRFHGCGLLGLSSLGFLVLLSGKVHDASTSLISSSLCFFHLGATAVHFVAAAESDVTTWPKEAVALKDACTQEAAMSPHLLLTVGFAAHAAGMLK
eukprot:Skav210806  [mRNA]  locus=scaffold2924:27953:29774:- [translate_table: standard]